MKHDVALLFGDFGFFPCYGEVIPPEVLWEDGAQVWGFIQCDCCGREVDKAILINGQYFCENCLEKKVQ
jgi:formylmethanofuran dehydrogenase subunit E